MRKRILNVALIGLIVMSVLGLATLMTGDPVAASSLPTPYAWTLTYGDNQCVISLWVDYDSQQVWGEVTTCTANTASCTEVDVILTSWAPEEYYTQWSTVGYPGECSTIDAEGENTVIGHVKVIWRVYTYSPIWPGYASYIETVDACYYFGGWDLGGVQGLVGNAATGYPLPYSTVTVKQSGQVIQVAETNYDGHYYISLPDGRYTVTASHIAFYDKTYTVVVSDGGFTTKNFLLTPKFPGLPFPI